MNMFNRILTSTFSVLQQIYRRFSAAKLKENVLEESKIQAWQVHSYGDISALQNTTTRKPQIRDGDDILVKVEAASVNPIDLLMLSGYGRTMFQIPRQFQTELPLTLGRDFCGTVINKGQAVGDDIKIGDQVYGFRSVAEQGSFSEVIVANKTHVCPKPPHLTAVESTSLIYATMTAWSALYYFGNLAHKQVKGTRILILGASGGVGTAAVQLLKSQGFEVYGTCSANAMPLVRSLGASRLFDYRDPHYLENVAEEGYFEIILDCAEFGYDNVPKSWKYGTYLVLNSPLLINTDKYGLVGGLLASAGTFLKSNLKGLTERKRVKWAFFTPSSEGLKFIHNLVLENKISPIIHKEFDFEHLPEAFKEVANGHLRGKVVVKF